LRFPHVHLGDLKLDDAVLVIDVNEEGNATTWIGLVYGICIEEGKYVIDVDYGQDTKLRFGQAPPPPSRCLVQGV